jgi:hypothetical protein
MDIWSKLYFYKIEEPSFRNIVDHVPQAEQLDFIGEAELELSIC